MFKYFVLNSLRSDVVIVLILNTDLDSKKEVWDDDDNYL